MTRIISIVVLLAGFSWACEVDNNEPTIEGEQQGAQTRSGAEGTPEMARTNRDDGHRALASIEAKSGSQLSGQAVFTQTDGTVEVDVRLEGASPGRHAVHIHENGDCSAPDASSAGEHWNPTNEKHGEWGEDPFHLGDIGNLEVGEDGVGSLKFSSDLWTLDGQEGRSVVGKAFVVHTGPDDFTTQPDGAAGDRVGCGVIESGEQT